MGLVTADACACLPAPTPMAPMRSLIHESKTEQRALRLHTCFPVARAPTQEDQQQPKQGGSEGVHSRVVAVGAWPVGRGRPTRLIIIN